MSRLQPGPAVLGRALVACGMTAFVVAVYAVVVLGGGAALGEPPGRPGVVLAVVATALVAAGLEPVRLWLRDRLLTSPYDVLAGFAAQVSGGVATDEVCPRIAVLLAEATGARCTEVRLRVGGTEGVAARWPATAGPIDERAPGGHVRVVGHGDDVLGRLVLAEGAGRPLTPVEHRLFDDLAAQAGPALRNVLLTAELARRVEQAGASAEELRASRERVVSASDAARMRLERDIHDGAQQHLVALSVRLSLAQTVASRDPARAAALVGALRPAADAALATLRDLSAGIHPRLLADEGLAAALRTAVTTGPVPVRVTDEVVGRHAAAVEAAVYFGCLEAVQNAIKHSHGSRVEVVLSDAAQALGFTVHDDGCGFDAAAVTGGSGLDGMRDRIASGGGELVVDSVPGAGTTVTGRVPTGAATAGAAWTGAVAGRT